jgi:hypothetical protein
MSLLDRYFQDIEYLAEQLEEGAHFETNLKSFMDTARHLKNHLFEHHGYLDVLDELDDMPGLDMSEPEKPLIQRLLPKSSRQMYGRYQHREKIREQVRDIARRFRRIRGLV